MNKALSITDEKRQQIALYIALAFHISGFIAIGLFNSQTFINLTPLNLLVCLALILFTQSPKGGSFWFFVLTSFVIGFASECIGVNTGIIYGIYQYTDKLGPKLLGVPYLIGVQWVVTLYCIGMTTFFFRRYLENRHVEASKKMGKWFMAISSISDGALLAVIFDWVMEPIATRLVYWEWANNDIPWLNYITWYVVSFIILLFFHLLPFRKENLFAVHLFLIQLMFFLLLRFTE